MEIEENAIKTKYEGLKKKYNLPSYEDICNEFEINDVLKKLGFMPAYFLRFLRRTAVDKLYSWVNYLHVFILPNQQSAVLMNEYQNFDEKKREEIIDYATQIMIISRKSVELELEKDEKEDAKLLKEAYDKLQELKPKLLEIAKENVKIWKEKR